MLNFFRKYQRSFFIFISFIVIASFSFFGSFGTFETENREEERIIGSAIDGSPLCCSQIQKLARFLATDREDAPVDQRSFPNLLNDGVVRYDFLRSGLADLLVAAYFDPMKEGFQSRLEKAKRFHPYTHPEAPFLSAKAVWERYFPAINQELAALQAESEAGPSLFSHLSKLYQYQNQIPPEWLRRILAYQHQQYPWLTIDQRLSYEDLSLFGFHSLTDWFGNDFVNLIAQFIVNTAILAEEKGYRVSLEEAKGDLLYQFEESMQKLAEAKKRPELTFHQQLRGLGFTEKSAAEVWQKVLLFRRYFQDVGQATFVDRLPYRDFSNYALETAVVQKYEWPQPLHFKTLQDLFEFQVYLKSVCPSNHDPLALPSSYLPLDEIASKNPELVQTGYKAKLAEVTKDQVGLRASMKEIWEWELDEKNWGRIRKEFSFVPQALSDTREARFQILEKLDPALRAKVDGFSRSQLVDLNPVWIEEALASARKIDVNLSISSNHVYLPESVRGKELASLLEKAGTGSPSDLDPCLTCYSENGTVYSRFEAVEKISDRQILPFGKARSILAEMTDQLLSDEYPKVRIKTPKKFQTKEGEWRPFEEVKEEVGLLVFAPLFKALDGVKNETKDAKKANERYVANRLLPASIKAWEAFQKNPSDPDWMQTGSDPLLDQFKLQQKEYVIQRTSKEDWMKEQAFLMVPNQWSPVHVADEGQIVFFYFKEKKPSEMPILERLTLGKETLAADAQRYVAERLIETAKGKKAIVIPLMGDAE